MRLRCMQIDREPGWREVPHEAPPSSLILARGRLLLARGGRSALGGYISGVGHRKVLIRYELVRTTLQASHFARHLLYGSV